MEGMERRWSRDQLEEIDREGEKAMRFSEKGGR